MGLGTCVEEVVIEAVEAVDIVVLVGDFVVAADVVCEFVDLGAADVLL